MNLRRLSQQIYSLSPLTARESAHRCRLRLLHFSNPLRDVRDFSNPHHKRQGRLRAPGQDLAISFTGAGGRTRTDNHRFTKPETSGHKSSTPRELRQRDSERAAPGAARRPPGGQPQHNSVAQTSPDLDQVVSRWAGLPEHIKAAILALVKTTRTSPEGTEVSA